MAKYSESQNKATQKYIHNNYQQLSIRLRKDGEVTRDTIAEAAAGSGLSVNAFILEAVREKMERCENGI